MGRCLQNTWSQPPAATAAVQSDGTKEITETILEATSENLLATLEAIKDPPKSKVRPHAPRPMKIPDYFPHLGSLGRRCTRVCVSCV